MNVENDDTQPDHEIFFPIVTTAGNSLLSPAFIALQTYCATQGINLIPQHLNEKGPSQKDLNGQARAWTTPDLLNITLMVIVVYVDEESRSEVCWTLLWAVPTVTE